MRFDGDLRTALSNKVIKAKLAPLIEARGGLDLLTGGPPVRLFWDWAPGTHAMNKHEIPTNHLYRNGAGDKALKPRAFLFENVEGILSSMCTIIRRKKDRSKTGRGPNTGHGALHPDVLKQVQHRAQGRRRADLLADLLNKITAKANQHRKANRGEIFRDVGPHFPASEVTWHNRRCSMPTDLVCPKPPPGDDSRRSQRIDQRHRKEACSVRSGQQKLRRPTPRQRRVVPSRGTMTSSPRTSSPLRDEEGP